MKKCKHNSLSKILMVGAFIMALFSIWEPVESDQWRLLYTALLAAIAGLVIEC